MSAWNRWYHVTVSTYGTWLPGDNRGWRSRDHQVHVDGDYKTPPPEGKYDNLRASIRNLLRKDPILLTAPQRTTVGQAMVEMLIRQDVELLCLSMDPTHCHMLGRFRGLSSRQAVGRAKKHAYHVLDHGRIWAKRCRTLPLRDRSHQVNVYRYILDHKKHGTWVWNYQQGTYWLTR